VANWARLGSDGGRIHKGDLDVSGDEIVNALKAKQGFDEGIMRHAKRRDGGAYQLPRYATCHRAVAAKVEVKTGQDPGGPLPEHPVLSPRWPTASEKDDSWATIEAEGG